jgi:3-dehydroquinate synthetase
MKPIRGTGIIQMRNTLNFFLALSVFSSFVTFAFFITIKGNISKEEVDDIKGVFEAFDMNGDISELSADDIVKTTKSDKKMVGDKIKFVLLRSVGDAYIDMSVTDDEMKQVLQG